MQPRESVARTFITSAVDGDRLSKIEFIRSEQAEQALTEALAYAKKSQSGNEHWAPADFVDSATACIDLTAWERFDRIHPTISHREYGAFVVRKGQSAKYIRLAPADDIDRDVMALEQAIIGDRRLTPGEINRILQRLYQEVVSPLEGSSKGVTKLLIVPDGKLTLAPINAFIDSRGQYLLQSYKISYIGLRSFWP